MTKDELKQVKKRNKQLCVILAQGESKSPLYLGCNVTKLVYGVSAQVRHKAGCTATEDD